MFLLRLCLSVSLGVRQIVVWVWGGDVWFYFVRDARECVCWYAVSMESTWTPWRSYYSHFPAVVPADIFPTRRAFHAFLLGWLLQ